MPGAGDAGFHQDDAEGSGGDSPPPRSRPGKGAGDAARECATRFRGAFMAR